MSRVKEFVASNSINVPVGSMSARSMENATAASHLGSPLRCTKSKILVRKSVLSKRSNNASRIPTRVKKHAVATKLHGSKKSNKNSLDCVVSRATKLQELPSLGHGPSRSDTCLTNYGSGLHHGKLSDDQTVDADIETGNCNLRGYHSLQEDLDILTSDDMAMLLPGALGGNK